MRQRSIVTPVGLGCLAVGVVLLLVETYRALAGNGLGTFEEDLLWVGLGVVVVGVVLLLLAAVRPAGEPGTGADADAEPVDAVDAEPDDALPEESVS